MFRRFVTIAGLAALAGSSLFADFSYQETTKITGGSLIQALRMMGAFSKQARQIGEPTQSTVAVKGDRMVHRNQQHMSIIDLGAETITNIDLEKKSYSVVTFAEMKQMLEQMSQKMQQKKADQPEMNFKMSAKDTGNRKQISGYDANEMVIRIEIEGADKKSGQAGTMVVVADTWTASVPGSKEARDFYRRMMEKINWTPNGGMFMSRPDVVQGMAEVYKQSAKLEGMPVYQVTTMGAEGTVPENGSNPQPAAQQPSQPAPERPSVGSALGSALGGKFGLGRKKPQQDAQPAPAAGASGNAQASGTLLEMTTEMSAFSSSPVDASQFEVPAGFKKVEHDMKRGMQ